VKIPDIHIINTEQETIWRDAQAENSIQVDFQKMEDLFAVKDTQSNRKSQLSSPLHLKRHSEPSDSDGVLKGKVRILHCREIWFAEVYEVKTILQVTRTSNVLNIG